MDTFEGRSRVITLVYQAINKLTVYVEDRPDSEVLIELAERLLAQARETAREEAEPPRGKPTLPELFLVSLKD